MKYLIIAFFLAILPASCAGFRAGVARAKITPDLPVWLNGYAVRTHPGNHVMLDLWAKALALDDGHGGRMVIVTADLLFLPRELTGPVADRCAKQFGLHRSQLLFNASHTHSGPAIWPKIRVFFDMNPQDTERAHQYALKLMDQLVQIVGESMHNMAPAELAYAEGEADFSINRRLSILRAAHPGKDFPAPVDHTVPVLRVTAPDGKVIAILFGYACHNTTLTGEFYEVSGDYAGFAQVALERAHPGAQAMFMQLCGADQNPSPRSRIDLPEKHGHELAVSIEIALKGSLRPLNPPLRTAYRTTRLQFAPHTRAMFEAEAKGPDPFRARRAKLMLEDYDKGHPVTSVPYPVEGLRIGDGLTIVALGGEVVLDYSIRAKKEYPNVNLVIAGYSNDVMSYIPSVRILHEGGYEAADSMIYYEEPGPYTDAVEDTIFQTIAQVMNDLGIKR